MTDLQAHSYLSVASAPPPQTQRHELKHAFIAKKQAARALIDLLPPDVAPGGALRTGTPSTAAVLKSERLRSVQEAYRMADARFKALRLEGDRSALFDGTSHATPYGSDQGSSGGSATTSSRPVSPASSVASSTVSSVGGGGRRPLVDERALESGRHGGLGPRGRGNGPTNDELLSSAQAAQERTTARLKEGLTVVVDTAESARHTAAVLQEDREKIQRASAGLDEIQGELAISKKLLTRLVKRLFTDRVILAMTCLLVCGIIGIVVFATLKPDQTIFNVPDAMKPRMPGTR